MKPALALALVLALPPRAGADSGSTGGATLGRPIGSRALALGEAFSAVEGDLDSIGFNPAGAARMKRPNLQLQYTRGVIEDMFSAATYGHPFKFGAVWAGVAYYDAGSVTLNFTNGSSSRVKAQQDYVATGGVALALPFGLSAGGQARIYRLRLAETATASGMAADFGGQARTPVDGLTFGASVRNAGPDVKYESEGDPLPLEGRVGAAYLLDLFKLDIIREQEYTMSQFLFSLDGVQPRDEDAWLGLGIEMRMPLGPNGAAAVRLGYKVNRPFEAPSIGVGLKEKRLVFDYAFGGRKQVDNVHHFTIGWLF